MAIEPRICLGGDIKVANMDIKRICCQVRRDLTSDSIPDAILLLQPVRAAISAIAGKGPTEAEQEFSEELVERLVRERPEAASLRARLKAKMSFRNGVFFAGGEHRPIIVEDLSVDRDTLYVRALATSEDCRLLIRRVEDILKDNGVPPAVFADVDDAYATEVSVQLAGPLDDLLSHTLKAFISEHLACAAKTDENTQVLIHPYSLELKVHQWPRTPAKPAEADAHSWTFSVSHESFDDHDKHCFKIYSRFDYNTHLRLLQALANCFPQA